MAWIENQFGHVLLLKQARGRKLWTLPGGKILRRESLIKGLNREVQEETGLKIIAPVLCGIFERPERDVITFLFRAKIKGNDDTVYPDAREIDTARYGNSLPRQSSPSLRYFWSQFHGHAPKDEILSRHS